MSVQASLFLATNLWTDMTRFNSDIHHRRSVRLKDYDYSRVGAYFVTVCAWQRECLFGEVVDGAMRLNEYGRVVQACWDDLPDHYPHIELDTFAIMPNHIHGIIVLTDTQNVGAGSPRPETDSPMETVPQEKGRGTLPLQKHTFGQIMGYFKYQSTKHINKIRDNPGCPVWQRNYYEHVIRNEDELTRARQYIVNNPLKWELDEENPANISVASNRAITRIAPTE